MPDESQVELVTREYARAWLDENGLCTCAGQMQIVSRRMRPYAVGTVAFLHRYSDPYMAVVLGDYVALLWEAQDKQWLVGMHAPGASAGPGTREEKESHGIGPHC